MKKIFASACLIIAFTIVISCNNNNNAKDSVDSAFEANSSTDSNRFGVGNLDSMGMDENFLIKAYNGGMLEVMLGNTAIKNAASPQVKQFGQMMVTDHTKADSEMAVIASVKNIALPSKPSNDDYDKINKLQSETGKEFDKDYISMMIDDHKKDIEDFKKAAISATDKDINAFATRTIPVLQKHLDKIQSIDSVLRKRE